jgi:hypothetical protein
MSDEIKHIGMPRRSGRYPWGSGGNPSQRNISFRSTVRELRKKGLSDVEIAKGEGINTTKLRTKMTLEKNEMRAADRLQAIKLKEHGYSNMEIGRKMGKNESSIRSLLDPVLAERAEIQKATVNMLKENVDKKRYIDIGVGLENNIGVSRTKLNTAVAELQEQGYKIHKVNVPQLGMPGKFTTMKVLGAPDTEWKELVNDTSVIQNIVAKSDDFGRTYRSPLGLKPVQSVDSKRIKVIYGEEGGSLKDGVIELRRGTSDLDLGKSNYAQVRIGVDGTHFLKGMAIYNDNMPEGVDIIFNTNKSDTGNKLNALKPMVLNKEGNIDLDNPFGSAIKRDGQRGALNVVNEEGDWATWSKTISSQILSKQTLPLAKKQLGLALKQKQEEYDEIMQLTNPVVKKQLLEAFADDCDSSAVHLKAAALPRQAQKVILPVPGLKETEVYAPDFNNGESVVLIRHPHGGRFEIPQVTVNNKSKAAQDIMKNAIDAVGINPKVAQKLSGADFDGDSVIVIPNNRGLIKTATSLKGLENFDPRIAYKAYEGMPKVASKNGKWPLKQQQMGSVSNLITDMTIKGANFDEVARAIRHSMVVVDAEKHNLNYKQSYIDNGIAALCAKYQNSSRGGASTLISKASSETRVPYRKEGIETINPVTGKIKRIYVDPDTGAKLYTPTGETYIDKKGHIVERKIKSTKMYEEQDAYKLSSGRPIEEVYANYANSLKTLGNTSRLKASLTKPMLYSPSANKVYEKEVSTLTANLNIALKNKPMERQAQVLANAVVKRKQEANPDMEFKELQKIRNASLAEMRVRVGAKKDSIEISDNEWAAIQAGAISSTMLSQIIRNANLDRVKQLATPRTSKGLSTSQMNRAQTLLNAGRTQAEVAEALGISVTILSKALNV